MKEENQELSALFGNYYEDRLKLYPLEATFIGDTRFNDLLPAEFTASYVQTLREFYEKYITEVKRFDRNALSAKDQISYDVFLYETDIELEALRFKDNLFPFNQFIGVPLSLAQWGSGTSIQPFKTMDDYDKWIRRATAFTAWADSAIIYFRKGIDENYVLPQSIVKKMIPQMEAILSGNVTKSIFYGPVNSIPERFSIKEKERIIREFSELIRNELEPSYRKLAVFLKNEYLPKARSSSGVNALPEDNNYYAFRVKQQTTTEKSPEEIYQTGLKEVERIKTLMDSVKKSTGFNGDLKSFFDYLRSDKKFKPFNTSGEVIDAFKKIHETMKPHVQKMFNKVPRTAFEIRQTEPFRAASASAEYNQGSRDGSRPGIFYVPILDPMDFNVTGGMESLFLHEAIPGHHYQISLQQEDSLLPRFRRFGGNNAYIEGWALYCESLGKELGLYSDPYQYMGALGDEMHRAIRLVVDVGLHAKGMTREEAIGYMMENEAIDLQGATAEIERYMVWPGQALGYKVGALKIQELRDRYEKLLGPKFSLAAFHDEILNDGPLPLSLLESKMDKWAHSQQAG